FSLTMSRPPIAPLFPYTTLFRSEDDAAGGGTCGRRSGGDGRGEGDRLTEDRGVLRRGNGGRAAGFVDGLGQGARGAGVEIAVGGDRKSTRLNSSHVAISYAVFCL